MDHAIDTGNQPLQARLAAAEPKQPRPDLEATGGQTLEEIQEPVDVTLEKLRNGDPKANRAPDPAAAKALENLPPDSLNANFSDMPPEERLQAMQVAGRRLAVESVDSDGDGVDETRAIGRGMPKVAGLPGRQRGGIGAPGRQLMPANRTDPRSDYDIGPGKPGTPRSRFEDQQTGGPRRMPYHAGTGSGGIGRQVAPESSVTELISHIDLNQAQFSQDEKDAILYAAHQMGQKQDAYDTSPEGERAMLDEAFRMVREHARKVLGNTQLDKEGQTVRGEDGKIAYSGGNQRIVGTNNPNMPFAYAETPLAKQQRETRDLTRRTHEYMGSHHMPDTLRGVTVNSTVDKNKDGKLNDPVDLHTALLDAAASGDMDTYQSIRQKLRGAEIQGQRAMLVQRRKMKATQTQMTDPEINRGVFASAMADAGTDPEAQAAVYTQWGMPEEAARVLGLKAQEAGIQDARDRANRQLDIDQQQADFPKGREQPQQNAIQAVDAMMAPVAAGALQQPGIGAVKEAERVGTAAGMKPTESRRVFARQFMQQPGASAAHPVMQECMRNEWEGTTPASTEKYGRQFINNCVQNLGVTEADAINWLKANQPQEAQRIGGGDQQAAQPAQPSFTPDMTNGGP
jgi:hypothetical protein